MKSFTVRICGFAVGIILTFLVSCKDKAPNYEIFRESDIEINLTPMSSPLKLSDFLSSEYRVVSLSGDVIGFIYDFYECDSLYILHGRASKGLVLSFDKNGNYIKSLLTRGQGADEVLNVVSIKLVEGCLYALVNTGRELWSIDPYTGIISDKFIIPDEIRYPSDFDIIGDKIIFYKSMANLALPGEQYKLYVYDKTNETIVNKYLPIDKVSSEYISFNPSGNLTKGSDGTLLFMEAFQNGVLRIDSLGTISPFVAFKHNEFTFPDEMLHEDNTFERFINYCENSDYIWAQTTIQSLPNLLISSFIYQQEPYLNFIATDRSKSYSSAIIFDDLLTDTKTKFSDWAHIIGAHNGNLYVAYPYSLLSNCRENPDCEFINAMNDDSNDLIVVFNEKK